MDSSTFAALFLVLTSFVPFTNQEIRHDNCVTWEDDLTTVTITCRLQNLVQPVNISSKKTGITIICFKINDKGVCSHKNSSVLFYDNKTVAIQIVVIKNKNLTGDRWECSQGLEKLFTNVSYIDGIKSDSWLNIRGKKHTDNNNTYIIVECGSCRVPDYNYLEFHINKMSNGSMVYNKDKGTCTYKRNQCQPFICNCSSVGNWYQLRLRLTNNIKEIACNGHFKDKLREGKLSITSNLTITGEEIIYGDSINEMIVQNKKAEKDNEVTTDAPENEDKRKVIIKAGKTELQDTGIIVGSVVGSVTLIGLVVIGIYICLRSRRNNWKRKVIIKAGKTELQVITEERFIINNDNNIEKQDAEEHLSLLRHNAEMEERDTEEAGLTEDGYGSCNLCKSSPAIYRCLPCDDNVCNKCALIHASSISTISHPILLISDVPEGLSLSRYCKVYNKEENTFCADHYKIVCEECSNNNHNFCRTSTFGACLRKEMLIEFESFLEQQLSIVSAMTSFLTAGIKLLDNNHDEVLNKIENFKSFQMELTSATVDNIKEECYKELELLYTKQRCLYDTEKDEIQQQNSQLINLKTNLDFIKKLKYTSEDLLFVYCISSKSKCEEIKTKIDEISPKLCRSRLKFGWTLSSTSLGRSQIKVVDYFDKRNTKRAVSKTPLLYTNQTLHSIEGTFDNIEFVSSGVFVLTTSSEKRLLLYNIKENEERNITLDCLPFDIAVAGSFTAVVTSQCEDAVMMVNFTKESCDTRKIKDSAKGSVATSESFILLALHSKQLISIFTHDLAYVYNIITSVSVDRLTSNDNYIAFLSSSSFYILDVQGEVLLHFENNEKPRDIISTNAGNILILEDSQKVIRRFTKNGRELEFKFDSSKLESVSAFCYDKNSSDIFILSKDRSTSVLSVLHMA